MQKKSDIVSSKKAESPILEPFDWWNYEAPVVPPEWVTSKVSETRHSVDWQNIFWDGKTASCFFYRTRPGTQDEGREEFITHILPGSSTVSKESWLRRIADLNSPSGDGYW
jgi:hypothetical protein